MDFGTVSKLLRDAVYCRDSTTPVEPAKAKKESVYCIE